MATSARRIRIVNPDLSGSERLILDADYSSGTSLTVKSNYGIQDNDILVIEQPSSEKAEASSVASTTGNTTITLDSAFKFSHQKGTCFCDPRIRPRWKRSRGDCWWGYRDGVPPVQGWHGNFVPQTEQGSGRPSGWCSRASQSWQAE